MSFTLTALLLLLNCLLVFGWHYGRATFYGNEPWYWPIHRGSCGFGYLCKDEGTGWDVAAISDQHWAGASCGVCFEFKCNPAHFTDGYGQTLDRADSCFDPEASVVATIVDTCPCTYAANAYSNRRWCCGDTDHFDLSVWAFEKLSDLKWGVISVYYRQVACDYQPQKKAPIPPKGEHWGEDPSAYGASCPRNNFPRYGDGEQQLQVEKAEQEAEEVKVGDTGVEEAAYVYETTTSVFDHVHSEVAVVYNGDDQSQFSFENWNAETWEIEGVGKKGGKAICGKVYPWGAISLKGSAGAFDGHMVLEFWTKVDAGLANAAITISGTNGDCEPLLFHQLQVEEYEGNYAKYVITLEQFMDGDTNADFDETFNGCANMSPSQIQRVSFHNYEYYEQYFCLDEIVLKKDP
eukprot:TRINITY_DN5136_c1_g1_i4.p1 TRINITY_DN5136_c1_g1~~TRINITY_DN5136_c1_g1_i4.p1  ORF type:complete len:406 (-),score=59.39 TRINITY_DN5136_c1_g1_i4:268-1485(-)